MSIYAEIETLCSKFSGTLGLWACNLDTQETIAIRAEKVFPAASTIKLPVLYEVWRQAGEGRFGLTDLLTMTADDQVQGSGVLKDLSPGAMFAVRDLATLMITVSDNTATNLLIDLVDLANVNKSMAALGLTGTNLDHLIFKGGPDAPNNATSPADLGRLMSLIARNEVLTAAACAEMLEILRRQQYTEGITRRVPDFDAGVATVASKSGAITGVRNEIGLVTAKGRRYVIAMMTEGCTDHRFHMDNEAMLFLAEVSAAIYDHFIG